MKKWINWKTIVTTIVLAAATLGWTKTIQEVQAYQELKKEVQANTEQRKQMMEQMIILKQVAVDVAGIKKSILTVTGKALVRDFGDDACLRINTSGRAEAYAKMKRARITNLTSAEMPSVVVKVEGTFVNQDANMLAIISQHAGSLIDVEPGQSVNIRVEPVEEPE